MTLRSVLLADGSSDLPLADHLEALCARHGREVLVTPVDERNLRTGRTMEDRLRFLRAQGMLPDLVFVHRDAEGDLPDHRVSEIRTGASRAGLLDHVIVPIVPVRMTEAWLLLDEAEIRRVAGRPTSTVDLGLPRGTNVERIADPKAALADALLSAADPSGKRRRDQFVRDFGHHRRLLLQRLDPTGPVTSLAAWQRLDDDIAIALAEIQSRTT